jgi:ABC-type multidrug transport system, ATPase component
MEKIIEIKNLVKKYGKLKALDNLSFDVNEGEILGLLGPNGSGKSTCLSSVLSLLKLDSGNIKIFGKEMTSDSYDIKSKIGVIFQDVAVFEELTVYENIDYFCGLYIKDRKKRKKYIEEAINLVSLNDFKKFYPKQLSGGLLRRLNIACGVAHKPSLIFLDEPTVAVDPQSRNNILEGIQNLNRNGATIVYTTHYMEEVEQICSRIIILDKGKIIAEGTKEELKELTKTEEKITIDLEESINSEDLEVVKKFGNIDRVILNEKTIILIYKRGKNNVSKLIEFLSKKSIKYNRIYSEMVSLNDVFLELTGKDLRD